MPHGSTVLSVSVQNCSWWSRNSLVSSNGAWQGIFSSAWLCQQSSWNRNSSVVRPPSLRPSVCGIDYLWSYCMDFFQIYLWLPLDHMPRRFFFCFVLFYFFFIFEKQNDFLRIFFVNMGPHGSENFKTPLLLQIAAESFQTFPEFSFPNDPHKTTFGIFEILKIEILTNFILFR